MIGLSFANDIECGAEITTSVTLTNDLNCSGYDDAVLTLKEGAELNLNGKKVIGNYDNNCIEIEDDGVELNNGTVTRCKDGIRIKSNSNTITSVEVSDSARRGIRINGNGNLLKMCLVSHNGRQGIKIEGANYNELFSNLVFGNCRDGIEIDGGSYNRVLFNHVEDNGNAKICLIFEEDYKPWFYAGIDVTAGFTEDSEEYPSMYNKIEYNRAGCNLGCVGSDEVPCTAHERDFWDENVDSSGSCISTNVWRDNLVVCKNATPECSPNPNPN
jgi:parallel beta-helix repeat protein